MKTTPEIELLREVAEAAQSHLNNVSGLSVGLDKIKRLRIALDQWEAHQRGQRGLHLQKTLDRWGVSLCVKAYRLNVEQGEGGTVIYIATGIPSRLQGQAIEAGEYWVKRCEQAEVD
jgi:hypothetical protein